MIGFLLVETETVIAQCQAFKTAGFSCRYSIRRIFDHQIFIFLKSELFDDIFVYGRIRFTSPEIFSGDDDIKQIIYFALFQDVFYMISIGEDEARAIFKSLFFNSFITSFNLLLSISIYEIGLNLSATNTRYSS